ncbi:rhomboid-like protein [Streptomyces sp. CA-251387]|uniref:rhomboid-like protein n=1 Tax=Streptomyces sp. CA-251387 TaxID=3240064 RepID=UPI003D8A4FC4
MERTVAAGGTGSTPGSAPSGATTPSGDAGLPDVVGLLDALPRQRGPQTAPPPPSAPPSSAPVTSAVTEPGPRAFRPWHLLPTPTGTPFTFAYAAVLAVTSLLATYADPALVHALHQGSSTDVAHLVRTPVLVLLASALWVAGGIVAPYTLCFLLVLTALERRIGGARTAVVFLTGHVLATLATEGPVGLAVLVGHLPDSSLHRLDYGISFGVATSIGVLAGLLRPWLRWPVLVLFGGLLIQGLLTLADPLTGWGHLISLAIGVGMWPVVRRWGASGSAGRGRPGGGEGGSGGDQGAVEAAAPPLGRRGTVPQPRELGPRAEHQPGR